MEPSEIETKEKLLLNNAKMAEKRQNIGEDGRIPPQDINLEEVVSIL